MLCSFLYIAPRLMNLTVNIQVFLYNKGLMFCLSLEININTVFFILPVVCVYILKMAG